MIDNLENEQWLPIEDYEDYEVSNYGRVKSIERKITHRNSLKTIKERILKSSTTKNGYQRVGLTKDGKQKMLYVHRLVAMAFLPNPNSLPQINHKDENPSNNHVSNLEWCTVEYNINYGTRNERHSRTISCENCYLFGKFGKEHHLSKQVIQLTLENEVVRIWDSVMDIQRKLGYHIGNICSCCSGRYKSSYGYKWCYA